MVLFNSIRIAQCGFCKKVDCIDGEVHGTGGTGDPVTEPCPCLHHEKKP